MTFRRIMAGVGTLAVAAVIVAVATRENSRCDFERSFYDELRQAATERAQEPEPGFGIGVSDFAFETFMQNAPPLDPQDSRFHAGNAAFWKKQVGVTFTVALSGSSGELKTLIREFDLVFDSASEEDVTSRMFEPQHATRIPVAIQKLRSFASSSPHDTFVRAFLLAYLNDQARLGEIWSSGVEYCNTSGAHEPPWLAHAREVETRIFAPSPSPRDVPRRTALRRALTALASLHAKGVAQLAEGHSATTDPPAMARASGGRSGSELAPPLGIAARIPALRQPKRAWMREFELRVVPYGDDKLGYLGAVAACRDIGMALCSAAQWRQACQTTAALEGYSSFASSSPGASVVVVGGGSCAARQNARTDDTEAANASACCSRAIHLKAEYQTGFLMQVERHLLRFEQALNDHKSEHAALMLTDKHSFYGAEKTRERSQRTFAHAFKADPNLWVVHGDCDVESAASTAGTWTTACNKTAYKNGKLFLVRSLYVWDHAIRKIVAMSDAKTQRVPVSGRPQPDAGE